MMNNETFENLLLDYVEGTLPDDVAAAMKRHAEAHPDCAASLDALEGDMRLSRVLFSKDRWVEPSSSLDQSILRQAEQAVAHKVPERPIVEESETLSWWARLLAVPSFQPVLAFCTVTLLVGGLWLASRGKNLPSLMQPKENASYKAERPSIKSSPKQAQRRLDSKFNDRFAGNIESGDQTRTVVARKTPPTVGQRWKGKVSKTSKNADSAPPRRAVSPPATGKLADSVSGTKATGSKAAQDPYEGTDKKEQDLVRDVPARKRSLPRRRARYRRNRRASRSLKRRRRRRRKRLARRRRARRLKEKKAKKTKALDELLRQRIQQMRRSTKSPSAEPSAPPRSPLTAKPPPQVVVPRVPVPLQDKDDDDDVDTQANRPVPRRRKALAPAPPEPVLRPKPKPRREFKPKPRRRVLRFGFQNQRRRARGSSTGSSTGYRPSQRYMYPSKKAKRKPAKPGRYLQRRYESQGRRPSFEGKDALGRAKFNQGLFYRSNQRQYLEKAISNYQSALKKAQRQKNQARVRTILLSMIRLYVRALQPHLAEQYVRDYVATFTAQQRAGAYRNVAQAYLQSGDAQNSRRWMRRSQRVRRSSAGTVRTAPKAQPTQKASPR